MLTGDDEWSCTVICIRIPRSIRYTALVVRSNLKFSSYTPECRVFLHLSLRGITVWMPRTGGDGVLSDSGVDIWACTQYILYYVYELKTRDEIKRGGVGGGGEGKQMFGCRVRPVCRIETHFNARRSRKTFGLLG